MALCVDALVKDAGWVRRRVDTVRFVDSATLARSVTLDLDLAQVREAAVAAGFPTHAVPVPLAVLRKGLLLDFDLRDASGEALRWRRASWTPKQARQ